MIKFDNVTKKFGDGTVALEEISLEVPEGQFIFIVGPSGAGKTTLFKLLRREILPSVGSIFFKDLQVEKVPESKIPHLRRKIAAIFQDFKLLFDRTLSENVALPLEVLDFAEHEIEKEVDKALERVGLGGKENYFPIQLAGGEVQRAAVARAIVTNPEVLLADEPTGELDPENTVSIIKLLEEINNEGKTVLVATHDVMIVNQFKKRVVTLDKGKITKDQKVGRYALS